MAKIISRKTIPVEVDQVRTKPGNWLYSLRRVVIAGKPNISEPRRM
jgi:hypothetical protein